MKRPKGEISVREPIQRLMLLKCMFIEEINLSLEILNPGGELDLGIE